MITEGETLVKLNTHALTILESGNICMTRMKLLSIIISSCLSLVCHPLSLQDDFLYITGREKGESTTVAP